MTDFSLRGVDSSPWGNDVGARSEGCRGRIADHQSTAQTRPSRQEGATNRALRVLLRLWIEAACPADMLFEYATHGLTCIRRPAHLNKQRGGCQGWKTIVRYREWVQCQAMAIEAPEAAGGRRPDSPFRAHLVRTGETQSWWRTSARSGRLLCWPIRRALAFGVGDGGTAGLARGLNPGGADWDHAGKGIS
jgi:hypothetical protein